MTELERLIQERNELAAKIKVALAAEKEEAIIEIRAKIAIFELTAADLGLQGKVGRPIGAVGRTSVAPKYRDPHTGYTWSGRGKAPKWIDGKDRTLFAL